MKRYNKLAFLALAAIGFSSCEDFLDVNPEMGVTEEEVYRDYNNFKGAVDRGYYLVHNYAFHRMDWDCEVGAYCDGAQVCAPTAVPTGNLMNKGLWMDLDKDDLGFQLGDESDDWGDDAGASKYRTPAGSAVEAIRAMNQCLANIGKLEVFPTDAQLYTKEEMTNYLKGQAFFLRGWHYFQIIMRYGGMPIMDHVYQADDIFDEVRPSYQESTDFIVSDMDSAIYYLPEMWKDSKDKGRVTVTSAKALKSMALLYAASPLMNEDENPYGSNSHIYDDAYTKAAAAAAAEAIASIESADSRYRLLPLDEYLEAFTTDDMEKAYSDEALFQPPYIGGRVPETYQGVGTGWQLPFYDGGWTIFSSPTQEAVDYFGTADGYTMEDAYAGLDANWSKDDPYTDRDPRLKMWIYCNGDDMYGGTGPSGSQPRTLEAFEGGWHETQFAEKTLVFTGYIHKKFRWEGNDKFEGKTGVYRIISHIRVAQVYLDFAEAANEAYGPTGAVPGTNYTALSAINKVRNRVGLPDVLTKYYATPEAFRAYIYNERAAELYQECMHRWYDIRRWKIAKDLFASGHVSRAYIHEVDGKMVYEKVPIESSARVFEEKHYWYPFKTALMNKFEGNFKQNPGW